MTFLCILIADVMSNIRLMLHECLSEGKEKDKRKEAQAKRKLFGSESLLRTGATFWWRYPILNDLSYLQQSISKLSCLLRMLIL